MPNRDVHKVFNYYSTKVIITRLINKTRSRVHWKFRSIAEQVRALNERFRRNGHTNKTIRKTPLKRRVTTTSFRVHSKTYVYALNRAIHTHLRRVQQTDLT